MAFVGSLNLDGGLGGGGGGGAGGLGSIMGDVFRPSLFELAAQGQMRGLLGPAFKYILTVYAQRFPRLLLPAHRRADELFALLMGLVELQYLRDWGGSFTENFYGLCRAGVRDDKLAAAAAAAAAATPGAVGNAAPGPGRLSASQIRASLLTLARVHRHGRSALSVRTLTLSIDPQILVPLVKTKLDELHERMTRSRTAQMLGGFVPMAPRAHEDADQAAPRRSALESAKRAAVHLFKTLYPLVLGGSSAVQLAFQIAYMFGKTEHYDPWLWLCGLKIKRLSMQDFQNYEKQAAAARDRLRQQMASASGLQIGLLGSRLALTWLLDFVRYALPMGIFFFKFLEWWYSSDYHKRADTQPIPPPPEPIEPHRHGVKLPRNHQICPLCLKSRTNPTMLPTGYVFCYPCVFNYVSEYGRCPVTHVRVDTEALRKIYSIVGSKLVLDNVYLNSLHALRRIELRNISGFALNVKLRSSLGSQIAFQLTNENLPDRDRRASARTVAAPSAAAAAVAAAAAAAATQAQPGMPVLSRNASGSATATTALPADGVHALEPPAAIHTASAGGASSALPLSRAAQLAARDQASLTSLGSSGELFPLSADSVDSPMLTPKMSSPSSSSEFVGTPLESAPTSPSLTTNTVEAAAMGLSSFGPATGLAHGHQFNQLFNYVNHIDEVRLEPGQSQKIIVAFLPEFKDVRESVLTSQAPTRSRLHSITAGRDGESSGLDSPFIVQGEDEETFDFVEINGLLFFHAYKIDKSSDAPHRRQSSLVAQQEGVALEYSAETDADSGHRASSSERLSQSISSSGKRFLSEMLSPEPGAEASLPVQTSVPQPPAAAPIAQSTAPSDSQLTVKLRSRVCRSVLWTDIGSTGITFDDCIVGGSYFKDFTIWNRSEIDLFWCLNTIDLSTNEDESWLKFTDYDTGEPIDASPVPSYSHRRIRVTFKPREVGEFNYDLQIENQNDSSNTIETRIHAIVRSVLREESLIISSGNLVDFGDCCAGIWRKKRISLKNMSDAPLDISFSSDNPNVVFQLKSDDAGFDVAHHHHHRHQQHHQHHHHHHYHRQHQGHHHTAPQAGSHSRQDTSQQRLPFGGPVQRASFVQEPLQLLPFAQQMADDSPAAGSDRHLVERAHDSSAVPASVNNSEFSPTASSVSSRTSSPAPAPRRRNDSGAFSVSGLSTSAASGVTGQGTAASGTGAASGAGGQSIDAPDLVRTASSASSFARSDDMDSMRLLDTPQTEAMGASSEEYTRIEELQLRAGTERTIEVCYRPERDSATPDYRAGRLMKRTFRITLLYSHPGQPSREKKTIQAVARTCTSFVEVTPQLLNFGDTDVGTLKSLPIQITNCSDLPARVELRFISKVLNSFRGEMTIHARQHIEVKVDMYPRKVNPDYRKQITVANLLNRENDQIVEVRSTNIDKHRVTFHSLFYQVLTPASTNFIDFGAVILNSPVVRTFTIENISRKRLAIEITSSMPGEIGIFVKSADRPVAAEAATGGASSAFVRKSNLIKLLGELPDSARPAVPGGTGPATDDTPAASNTANPSLGGVSRHGRLSDAPGIMALDLASLNEPAGRRSPSRKQSHIASSSQLRQIRGPPDFSRKTQTGEDDSPFLSATGSSAMTFGGTSGPALTAPTPPAVVAQVRPTAAPKRGLGPNAPSADDQQQPTLAGSSGALASADATGVVSASAAAHALARTAPGAIDAAGAASFLAGVLDSLGATVGSSLGILAPATEGLHSSSEDMLQLYVADILEKAPLPLDAMLLLLERSTGTLPPPFPRASLEEKYAKSQLLLRRELEAAIQEGRLAPASVVEIEPEASATIVLVMTVTSKNKLHVQGKPRKHDARVFLRLRDFDRDIKQPQFEQLLQGDLDAIPVRELMLRSSFYRSIMELGQKNINFGALDKSERRAKSIVIRNNSEAPLLYTIVKSGSISSGDIVLSDYRIGVVRGYGKREVEFIFEPSLAGQFHERLFVKNIQDSENDQIMTIKANVRQPAHFFIEKMLLEFGVCLIDQPSPVTQEIAISNTSQKHRRTFEVGFDPDELRFQNCLFDVEFEIVDEDEEEAPATDSAGPSGVNGSGAALAHGAAASGGPPPDRVRKLRKRPAKILSQEIEEQIEQAEQKLNIAKRKGRKDKIKRLTEKLEKLRSGEVPDEYATDKDEILPREPPVIDKAVAGPPAPPDSTLAIQDAVVESPSSLADPGATTAVTSVTSSTPISTPGPAPSLVASKATSSATSAPGLSTSASTSATVPPASRVKRTKNSIIFTIEPRCIRSVRVLLRPRRIPPELQLLQSQSHPCRPARQAQLDYRGSDTSATGSSAARRRTQSGSNLVDGRIESDGLVSSTTSHATTPFDFMSSPSSHSLAAGFAEMPDALAASSVIRSRTPFQSHAPPVGDQDDIHSEVCTVRIYVHEQKNTDVVKRVICKAVVCYDDMTYLQLLSEENERNAAADREQSGPPAVPEALPAAPSSLLASNAAPSPATPGTTWPRSAADADSHVETLHALSTAEAQGRREDRQPSSLGNEILPDVDADPTTPRASTTTPFAAPVEPPAVSVGPPAIGITASADSEALHEAGHRASATQLSTAQDSAGGKSEASPPPPPALAVETAFVDLGRLEIGERRDCYVNVTNRNADPVEFFFECSCDKNQAVMHCPQGNLTIRPLETRRIDLSLVPPSRGFHAVSLKLVELDAARATDVTFVFYGVLGSYLRFPSLVDASGVLPPELDLGNCYVDPSRKYALVKPLVVENTAEHSISVTANSNLAQQCFIFGDPALERLAHEIPLAPGEQRIVFIALQPSLGGGAASAAASGTMPATRGSEKSAAKASSSSSPCGGATSSTLAASEMASRIASQIDSRTLIGGIKFAVSIQDSIESTFLSQATKSAPSADGTMLLATQTLRFSATIGQSLLMVSQGLFSFGVTRCVNQPLRASFWIYNLSSRLPLDYELRSSSSELVLAFTRGRIEAAPIAPPSTPAMQELALPAPALAGLTSDASPTRQVAPAAGSAPLSPPPLAAQQTPQTQAAAAAAGVPCERISFTLSPSTFGLASHTIDVINLNNSQQHARIDVRVFVDPRTISVSNVTWRRPPSFDFAGDSNAQLVDQPLLKWDCVHVTPGGVAMDAAGAMANTLVLQRRHRLDTPSLYERSIEVENLSHELMQIQPLSTLDVSVRWIVSNSSGFVVEAGGTGFESDGGTGSNVSPPLPAARNVGELSVCGPTLLLHADEKATAVVSVPKPRAVYDDDIWAAIISGQRAVQDGLLCLQNLDRGSTMQAIELSVGYCISSGEIQPAFVDLGKVGHFNMWKDAPFSFVVSNLADCPLLYELEVPDPIGIVSIDGERDLAAAKLVIEPGARHQIEAVFKPASIDPPTPGTRSLSIGVINLFNPRNTMQLGVTALMTQFELRFDRLSSGQLVLPALVHPTPANALPCDNWFTIVNITDEDVRFEIACRLAAEFADLIAVELLSRFTNSPLVGSLSLAPRGSVEIKIRASALPKSRLVSGDPASAALINPDGATLATLWVTSRNHAAQTPQQPGVDAEPSTSLVVLPPATPGVPAVAITGALASAAIGSGGSGGVMRMTETIPVRATIIEGQTFSLSHRRIEFRTVFLSDSDEEDAGVDNDAVTRQGLVESPQSSGTLRMQYEDIVVTNASNDFPLEFQVLIENPIELASMTDKIKVHAVDADMRGVVEPGGKLAMRVELVDPKIGGVSEDVKLHVIDRSSLGQTPQTIFISIVEDTLAALKVRKHRGNSMAGDGDSGAESDAEAAERDVVRSHPPAGLFEPFSPPGVATDDGSGAVGGTGGSRQNGAGASVHWDDDRLGAADAASGLGISTAASGACTGVAESAAGHSAGTFSDRSGDRFPGAGGPATSHFVHLLSEDDELATSDGRSTASFGPSAGASSRHLSITDSVASPSGRRMTGYMTLRGCKKVLDSISGEFDGLHELDLGQQDLGPNSVAKKIVIENTSGARLFYRIGTITESDRLWMVCSRSEGTLEAPRSAAAANGAATSHTITLNFMVSVRGTFSTYLLIENIDNRHDTKIIRVSMEVVAKHNVRRSALTSASPGFAGAVGITMGGSSSGGNGTNGSSIGGSNVTSVAAGGGGSGSGGGVGGGGTSAALVGGAPLSGSSGSGGLGGINSSGSGHIGSRYLHYDAAGNHAFDVFTQAIDSEEPVIEIDPAFLGCVYASRSIVVCNRESVPLEFSFKCSLPHEDESELVFSLSPTSAKLFRSIIVEPESHARVYIRFWPGQSMPSADGLEDTESMLSKPLGEQVAVERLFEVHINCRLVKDYQKVIKFLAQIRQPQIMLSSSTFLFSGMIRRKPVPADVSSDEAHSLRPSVDAVPATGSGALQPSAQTQMHAQNIIQFAPTNDLFSVTNLLNDTLEYEILTDGMYFSIELVDNADVASAGSPGAGAGHHSEAGASFTFTNVGGRPSTLADVASGSSQRLLIGPKPQGVGRPLWISTGLLTLGPFQSQMLRIVPLMDVISKNAEALRKEKYILEHMVVYNKRRPSEKYGVHAKLCFGNVELFHFASGSRRSFLNIESHIVRLVHELEATPSVYFDGRNLTPEAAEKAHNVHFLYIYVIDEMIHYGTREQGVEAYLQLATLLFTMIFSQSLFKELAPAPLQAIPGVDRRPWPANLLRWVEPFVSFLGFFPHRVAAMEPLRMLARSLVVDVRRGLPGAAK